MHNKEIKKEIQKLLKRHGDSLEDLAYHIGILNYEFFKEQWDSSFFNKDTKEMLIEIIKLNKNLPKIYAKTKINKKKYRVSSI